MTIENSIETEPEFVLVDRVVVKKEVTRASPTNYLAYMGDIINTYSSSLIYTPQKIGHHGRWMLLDRFQSGEKDYIVQTIQLKNKKIKKRNHTAWCEEYQTDVLNLNFTLVSNAQSLICHEKDMARALHILLTETLGVSNTEKDVIDKYVNFRNYFV